MSHGFDPDRLACLKPWMQRWVDAGRYAGAQTLIARRGEVVYCDHVGQRDVANALPWERDTIVRIYSMTKPITSAILLMLYEEALCHLDTPLDEFLPEMADRQVLIEGAERIDQVRPAGTRLTLHHLLTHTSGFTYGFNLGLLAETMQERQLNFAPRRVTEDGAPIPPGQDSLEKMVHDLAELPLGFDPGARWNYGVSTDVLGRVIEVITGRPLDQVFRERVLDPLGLDDTGFTVPEAKQDRLAACYVKTDKDPMKLMDRGKGSAFSDGKVAILSGGGGLCSTVDDYLKFAEMLRRGGEYNGTRLLAPKTVEIMTRNGLRGDLTSMGQPVFSEVSYDGVGFGLGVAVMLDPGVAKTAGSEGDYGWGGMASTVFWVDPKTEMTCIFFTQLVPSSSYPVRKEIRSLAYSSLTDPNS